MSGFKLAILSLLSAFVFANCAMKPAQAAQSPKPTLGFDAELSGFEYPFPVKTYSFRAQNQDLKMAYMDVSPEKPSGKTIVLFHGKNFSGFYFKEVAQHLKAKGYRVVILDQIGFGKSTKPQHFQFSLQALASYSNQLLESIGVKKFTLFGHSMGGMLATRYSLMFPDQITKLFLIAPIGLEDWKTMTSYRSVDQLYASELASSAEKIKNYQMANYYGGEWKSEYDKLLIPAAGWLSGPDYPLIAWNAALTSEMLMTQPVYYEFKLLKPQTVLVIGTRDRTALGKDWAPEEMKKKMGFYPKLGKDVAKLIPHGKLIAIENTGHLPFIEVPEKFWALLDKEL